VLCLELLEPPEGSALKLGSTGFPPSTHLLKSYCSTGSGRMGH